MKQQIKVLVSATVIAAAFGMSSLAQAESQQVLSEMQQLPSVALTPSEVLNRISDSPRVSGYMQRNLQYLENASKPDSVQQVEVSIQL